MSLSNSDVAAILRFVHPKTDTFIRQLTIQDNQDPRQPVNLSGYYAVFEISTIKNIKSVLKITSRANAANINISGDYNNLINLSFATNTMQPGRYNYVLSVVDSMQNVKTWLKGDFIIT